MTLNGVMAVDLRYFNEFGKLALQKTICEGIFANALFLANLESLKDRRIKLSQSFFKKTLSTDSCLHTLLPPERNNEIFCKLRNPSKYPIPYSRTKKYQSFLNYALAKFQNSM